MGVDDPGYKEFVNALMEGQFITPDLLYLDLFLLKDLHIGAIMSLAIERDEGEDIYNLISKNLDNYRQRYFLDPCHYLSLPYTKEEVDSRLADEHYHDDIYLLSPMTNVLDSLINHIFININHSAIKDKVNDITVHINTYPLKLSKKLTYALGIFIRDVLQINVKLLCKPINEFTVDELMEYDEYYLYYFKEFSDHKEIMKLASDFKLIKKRLFTIPHCGYEFQPKEEEDLAKELLLIDTSFSLVLSQFNFFKIHDCSPK